MKDIIRGCQLDQYFTTDDQVYMKEALDSRLRKLDNEEDAAAITTEAVDALYALTEKVRADVQVTDMTLLSYYHIISLYVVFLFLGV